MRMKTQYITAKKFGQSFAFAFSGIVKFVTHERNGKLHLLATALVIAASFIWSVSAVEIIALSLVTGLVWIAEMFNTCLEKLIDFMTTEKRPELGFIKDMAAGAVLIAALVALLTGLFIFIPKIL